MKKGLVALLLVSITINGWLWKRSVEQRDALSALRLKAAETDSLRWQVQELEAHSRATNSTVSISQVNELARLRNEVGLLRQQLKDNKPQNSLPVSWRRMPATADWSEKFAAATNELAEKD